MTKDKVVDVTVLLICGLPGSGKSTLRKKLVDLGWAYASQDEMGTRDAFDKALIKALKDQKSCILDRCNVTSDDRRMCMQVANQAVEKGTVKGVALHYEAVWMATPPDLCKQRALGRKHHETLGAADASGVIDKFCKNIQLPQRTGKEPYEAVHMVTDDKDVELLVQRYADPTDIDVNVGPSQRVAVANVVPADAAGIDPSLPAELLIVRHGERADRAKGRVDDYPDDAALTKEGRETAKRAGIAMRAIARSPVVVVYSSPFFRCLQTANEIAAELGCLIRIEPGLSEICSDDIFEKEGPQLRQPHESTGRALQRVEVDLSERPVEPSLPKWPETAQDAKHRVRNTAMKLAQRHPGQAICLVCHAHSVIEITRHYPGGGAAGSRCGYCAMSHISHNGVLQHCLDVSYLKDVSSRDGVKLAGSPVAKPPMGCWEEDWCWTDEVEHDPVDELLEMSLDEALAKYPKFRQMFEKGREEQKDKWRQDWSSADDNMRWKLRKAYDGGVFGGA